jgi:hypothetical protein
VGQPQSWLPTTGREIFVSTFLYANRSHRQQNLDKSVSRQAGRAGERGKAELWFDPAVVPYHQQRPRRDRQGPVWCGELNILPTAARPLSGLEVYTGRASMIVPHTHLAMQSIATIGGAAKLNYTTGTVTQRNYIQRKEGFKAEFHHCYGGLLVEVDDEGHWWVRQLNADSDGTIYDLDVKVSGGKVTTGNRVEAITFGDVHVANIDDDVAKATWGKGGMVDKLRPKYQILHDVLDFYSRSHHTLKDPYKAFKRHMEGAADVAKEVADSATSSPKSPTRASTSSSSTATTTGIWTAGCARTTVASTRSTPRSGHGSTMKSSTISRRPKASRICFRSLSTS